MTGLVKNELRLIAAAVFTAALAVGTESAASDGSAIYRARCARCHGESGRSDTAGARALKVKPLALDAKLARMAPADLVALIKSDTKHRSMGALDGLDDSDLRAAAAFVKKLAK